MHAIRIMTYNIRHGEGLDGRQDLARIAAVVQAAAADLVAVQEMDRHTDRVNGRDQLADLAAATGMAGVFGRSIDYRGGTYGNALLSRLPVLAEHRCALPGREARSVVAADVALPGGIALRVAATHLDLQAGQRLEAADRLLAFLASLPPLPTVLAGDFNEPADAPALLALLGRGWRLAEGDQIGPTYPADAPQVRIDHILCRGLPPDMTLAAAAVVAEPLASDHRPVLAILERRDAS